MSSENITSIIPGMVLANRFRTIEKIAQGGQGELWLASDFLAGGQVVIKSHHLSGDEELIKRLKSEAHNNEKLDHPNIVRCLGLYDQDNLVFIVMEFVSGQNLASILKAKPILPAIQTKSYLKQIAKALAHAHNIGVIHRDIKPANILINHQGMLKLTDFGISATLGQTDLTQAGKVVGTAQYISPEQAIGAKATPASDIYALGIMAFEITQGFRPFTGNNILDIINGHIKKSIPDLNTNTDPKLKELIVKMLDKNPLKRPSANEIIYQLDSINDENFKRGSKQFLTNDNHVTNPVSINSPRFATINTPITPRSTNTFNPRLNHKPELNISASKDPKNDKNLNRFGRVLKKIIKIILLMFLKLIKNEKIRLIILFFIIFFSFLIFCKIFD